MLNAGGFQRSFAWSAALKLQSHARCVSTLFFRRKLTWHGQVILSAHNIAMEMEWGREIRLTIVLSLGIIQDRVFNSLRHG